MDKLIEEDKRLAIKDRALIITIQMIPHMLIVRATNQV